MPNRAQFRQFAEQALHHVRRHSEEVAIMFIDLDNFKAVNDDFGHPIGNKLLMEVAERIQQNLRQDDSVSRIGGDEFKVLVNRQPQFERIDSGCRKNHQCFKSRVLD